VQATPAAPRPASPQQAATITPAPAEEAVVWEQFAVDTDDLTAHLDTGPTGAKRKPRLAQSLEADRTRRRLYLIMGVALTLALAGGLIVWFVLTRNQSTTPPKHDGKQRQAMTFHVGPDAEYQSINALLNKLRPGDTVIVQTDVLREKLHIDNHRARTLSGVHIEADQKRPGPVVWKLPENVTRKDEAIVQLEEVENFTIKGFTFDGENRTNNLIVLLCGCSGVTLDGLKLQNYLETGVRFTNCMAPRDAPVVLTNVQASGDRPPLLFEVRSFFKKYLKNDHIIVRDDCTFTGNFKIKLFYLHDARENEGVQLPAGLPREDVKLEIKPVTPPKS
jgi:hypothetical protein